MSNNNLSEGTYTIEVTLVGGSGRATITSPAKLEVKKDKAVLSVEWSSANYDYMIVDGETYYPVNEEGNSVFELPITALEEPLEVIADTTAMSVPHEIEYQIICDASSISNISKGNNIWEEPTVLFSSLCLCAALLASALVVRRKKQHGMK